MKAFVLGIGLSLLCGLAAAQRAPTAAVAFNISAQPLGDALNEFAQQSGVQLLINEKDMPPGRNAPEVTGMLKAEEALRRLLDNTGLGYKFVTERTVAIGAVDAKVDASRGEAAQGVMEGRAGMVLAQADAESVQSGDGTAKEGNGRDSGQGDERVGELEEIVVTGTHIRGATPASSALTVYDRRDIERSGVTTMEQFARLMPQNFASLDATAFLGSSSGFSQGGSNAYSGAGFNLRGLGPGATLTLLNGHRLTPGGSNGDFIDVSLIPLSAIERIEVLTDGASAIYGADAVAGVVNMILRKDLDGAETTLRYGDTTRGGGDEFTAAQMLGGTWDRGSAMFVYEHYQQNPVLGSQRAFIPETQSITTLQPEQRRNSVFGSARYDLLPGTTLSAEAFFSERDFLQDFHPFGLDFLAATDKGGARQHGGVVSASQRLPGAWRADLSGNYSRLEQRSATSFPSFTVPEELEIDTLNADTQLGEVGVRADGPLFALPGGAAKLALGFAHRTEKLDSTNAINDAGAVSAFDQSLRRQLASVYGELILPFIGADNPMAGAQRLELSLAARYDDYDDAGSASNPKIGVLWSPARGLNLRATYATSFRAPLLTELNETFPTYVTFNIDNPAASSGQTNTLTRQGVANANLRPEESESFTAGFDFTPAVLPDLRFGAGYFRTVFSDRIAGPPIFSVFAIYSQVEELAPFFDFSPDPAEVQAIFDDPGNSVFDLAGAGPGGVEVFFDLRPANIAETRQSGIEFSASYDRVSAYGTFNFSVAGDYFLEIEYQPVLTAPAVTLLNVVGQPVDLRLRGGLGWSRGGLSAFLALNHWSDYRNVFFTPSETVASSTTADLQLSYRTSEHHMAALLRDLSLNFTIQNLMDEDPPHVAYPPGASDSGYDPANASALGRSLAIALTKRW